MTDASDRWVAGVKDVLEETSTLSTQEYHDGLQEILEEVYSRYECALGDLERAAEDEEE